MALRVPTSHRYILPELSDGKKREIDEKREISETDFTEFTEATPQGKNVKMVKSVIANG